MQWFFNLKIGKKLIVSFVLIAILTGITGTYAIINLNDINRDYKEMYDTNGKPLGDLGNIGMEYQITRLRIRNMIGADQAKIAESKKLIQEAEVSFRDDLKNFSESIRTEEHQKNYDRLEKATLEYIEVRDQIIALLEQGKNEEALAVMQENSALAENVTVVIREIFANRQQNGDDTVTALSNRATNTITILVVIVAVAMVLAVLLGVFISRIISRPVNEMVSTAKEIANGNLNVNIEVKTKDEIGMLAQAFSQMASHLNDVIINIRSASDQVATGAKQMSESSLLLSQGATEQASSVEQLTASLEEISEKININAELSEQSNELTQVSKDNALEGNQHMKEMLVAMDEINSSSTNISKIIKVIDEIAFQTNILALNAAVEAARAGQHGKGFAVVAEEVRNLAARSANAAKETTEMIESSITKVDGGMKIATDTAKALSQIVENITKVADISSQISIASAEQAAGIQQINQGLAQVSTVIQTNSSTSEESAAASEELSSQANMMREQIATFRTKNITGQALYNVNNDIDQAFAKATSNLEPISISDKEFGKY